MLVIRRRAGEAVVIETPAGPVEIGVYEISPSRVKLAIQAPGDVLIMRKEMLLAREQNRAAVQALSPGAIETLVGRWRGHGVPPPIE